MTQAEHPDPFELAQAAAWIAALPPGARGRLAGAMQPVALRGGDELFHAGAAADALYLLHSGSLGAFTAGGDLIGQIVAGETVGELGLLTGRPRMASVRALRDSELWRLERSAFDAIAGEHPQALVALARLALERNTGPARSRVAQAAPRTLALLPQHEGIDAIGFGRRLGEALARYGKVAVIDLAAGAGHGHDPAWFAALEAEHRYVLYVGTGERSDWRALCLRQADALLFLAHAGASPAPWCEAERGVEAPLPRPEHLALIHTGKPRLGAARRWQRALPRARLHHVRGDADAVRVARLISGRSVGLVLSGGGARGFAHLGVIKALREAGMEIDAVGGTSIGAIVGAGLAADWSTEEMIAIYRRSFVDTNPLSDWTVPFVSMVAGRKVSRLLREAFGEREIEDLVLPFYCVTANLTDGKAVVHRSGPLWQWLRASVAIPGVLPPVFHHGQVYVDGGVISNLPVDVMAGVHAGEVIAVDIGGDYAIRSQVDEADLPPLWRMIVQWYTRRRRPSILQILLRAGMVNAGAASRAAREASDLLISPPLGDIDLLAWKSFDRAIEIGYQHALRVIGGPKDALTLETPYIEL